MIDLNYRALLIILILSTGTFAITEDKLEFKWKVSIAAGIGAIDIADIDMDGTPEIIVGTHNATILIYDGGGILKYNFSLGKPEDTGKVYALRVSDIDFDSYPEIIVGLGGQRVVTEYPWDEYRKTDDETIVRLNRILVRTLRNKGSVRVIEANGTLRWVFPTETSVNDIFVADIDKDNLSEIVLGTGSYSRDDYWVQGPSLPDGEENWTFTQYSTRNGSILLLDNNGELKWLFNLTHTQVMEVDVATGAYTLNLIPIKSSTGGLAPSGKSRVVFTADLADYGVEHVLGGSDNGFIYVLDEKKRKNWSSYIGSDVYLLAAEDVRGSSDKEVIVGAADNSLYLFTSSGALIWKYRIPTEPKSMQIVDIENDGDYEIVIGSRGNYIYVLDGEAILEWKQFLRESLYNLKIADLDGDEFLDVVVASEYNLTRYEMSEYYVMKQQADAYYRKADEAYSIEDLVLSNVYLEKSNTLYKKIGNQEGLSSVKVLKKKLEEGRSVNEKMTADFNYQKALELYSMDNYDGAKVYLKAAREIYVQINDRIGISRVDSLMGQIGREFREIKMIQANSLYLTAESLISFRNYTGAGEALDGARAIYQELNDSEGMGKTDNLTLELADAYYNRAKKYVIALKYETALNDAIEGKKLYEYMGDREGITKSALLISEIEIGLKKKPRVRMDWFGKVLPAIFVILVILLLSSVLKRKEEKYVEKELKNLEEEL